MSKIDTRTTDDPAIIQIANEVVDAVHGKRTKAIVVVMIDDEGGYSLRMQVPSAQGGFMSLALDELKSIILREFSKGHK